MSSGIRMTGLISNMDTEMIVNKLMEAQKTKVTKIKNKQTKLEWQDEKWKDLNKKLYALYQEQTSAMHISTGYTTKKATSGDETKVKVTANNSATTGTHSIEIKDLASSQYVTSGKITTDGFSVKTKLSDIGFTSGESVIKIKSGSKEYQLGVNDSTTVNDFLSACKNVGLNANYDSTQKRIFISSANSGKGNEFTITSGNYTSEGMAAKSSIVNLVSSSNQGKLNTLLPQLQAGGDTSSIEQQLVDFSVAKADEEAKTKATEFYRRFLSNDPTVTDLDEATVRKIEEKYQDETDEAVKLAKIANAKEEKQREQVQNKLNTSEYQALINTAITNGLSDSQVASSLGISDSDEINAYTFKSKEDRTPIAETQMKDAISAYKTVYSSGGIDAPIGASPLTALGLGEIGDVTTDKNAAETGNYTLIAAKSCKVIYNGAELENDTNTINVNGLTIEAIGKTNGSPVSIDVKNDTDAVYNKIKEFFKSYNAVLKELNEAYYADSSRGYDPLTDEQKEAMTDDQIKKWEDKIKKSLLRRDDTVGSLASAMKTALQGAIEVDGKKYSLASFGIMTSKDYTEKGLLHIYGDKEDSTYADEKDKLKKALEEDPDKVTKVLSGLIDNLHKTLIKKMGKTSLSSALTFYNDKSIKDQIDDYKDDVKTMEKKLDTMENKYYKQFSAMETALAKLQEQQSALSGLLGQ